MNGRGQRRVAALGIGAVLAGSVLAGCGGHAAAPPAPTPGPGVGVVTTAPDGVQQVTIQTQDDYVFTPDHFTVSPGKVRLTVTNVGRELTHNFRFTPGKGPAPISAEIPLLPAGHKETIEFTVTTPGDYGFECTFHVQLGQVGTMTVRG